MDSGHGIEPEAIARAQRYDEGLDVDSLIRALTGRASWASVTNRTAYFVGAAKRAKAEGEHRRLDAGRAKPGAHGVDAGREQTCALELVRLMREAAHGAAPDKLASGIRALTLAGYERVRLDMVRAALEEHGNGWNVEREDIPF